jgi:hypothetical protein
VRLLLDRGASPDPREGRHRSAVEALPDLEIVELLLARGARLEAGADRSKQGWGSHSGTCIQRTALEHARALGRPELARTLDESGSLQLTRALALGIWQVPIVSRRALDVRFFPNDEQATLVIGFGGGSGAPGTSSQGTAAEQLARHGELLRQEAAWFVPFACALARGETIDVDALIARAGGFLQFGEA